MNATTPDINAPVPTVYEDNADPRRYKLSVDCIVEGKYRILEYVVYFVQNAEKTDLITFEKMLSTLNKLGVKCEQVISFTFTTNFKRKIS